MSDINADVTENTITVSVSGDTIAATVSGGQGPQGPQGASGVSTWAEISGKPTTLAGYEITDGVTTSDARLTDSREWSASTVSQAEAEAGTATTRRAFTAQRVFQAIAAWWSASGIQATIDGKAAASHAHGNITTDGRVGTAASKILVTETGGTVGVADRVFGTSQVFIDADPGLPVIVRADGGIEEGLVPLTSVQTYFGYDSLYGDIDYIWTSLGGKASSTHASTHAADGSDPLSLSPSQIGPTLGGSADIGADISTLAGLVTNCAAAVHTHSASDVTSGTFDAARLPLATTSVRGAMIVGTGLGVSSGTVSVQYGSSGSTACAGNDSRLSDARTPLSHTHGNISNAGAIGSTANQVVVTTTSGVLTTATIGSGLTLSGGTLTASGGGGGSSVGSDLFLWSTFR